MTEIAKCEICGEPMPQGETMFKFHGYSGPCPKPPLLQPHQRREMVSVTKEDANNYCRVLTALGMEEEGDPVAGIEMLRRWEVDAQVRAELLEQHLRAVLEVARTWQPDYATKMDCDTLQHAQDCADHKTPNEAP